MFQKVKQLTKELNSHKKTCTCETPIDQRIIKTEALFDKFFEYIKPLVKRKWRGPRVKSSIVRRFKNSPKKIGPNLKLSGREEFLLCLMKIRLGLLHENLTNQFLISKTLARGIFSTWVKTKAAVLKSPVFVPKMENIVASRPKKFSKFSRLHSIADATEIFLQTPKNNAAQLITWSNYKHYHTAKVLITISPNGLTFFASEAYGGSISDKQLTVDSRYLDLVEP